MVDALTSGPRRARLAPLLLAALAGLVHSAPSQAVQSPGVTTGSATSSRAEPRLHALPDPLAQDAPEPPALSEREAIARALAHPDVAAWLRRYDGRELTEAASFERGDGLWTVKVWAPGDAGQIVLAKVEDESARVTEAWTGPQVAWKMARGYEGAFGRAINEPAVWLGFCALFFLGLADWRRPLALQNLDLLVLLSFSASLALFNAGDIFRAMPLAYPPLLYLLARTCWIGWRGRARASLPVWPVWVLVTATVFLVGFRVGLNVEDSNVVDVGYAGVIGAQRIVGQGEMPYGHMPTDDGRKCGEPDADGYVRERVQTNGRCESANDRGDTYGPVAYLAYVPGYLAFGWSGKWDELPAAHLTSILFDLLALAGFALVGYRFGGTPLAATLAFAWASYPFTQYVSSSNSNDAIMPALLVWGFWLLGSPPARGFFLALASWTKFASILLLPLWASYPQGLTRAAPRRFVLFGAGFLVATVLSFSVLFLEPDPVHAVRVFWERTFGWQLSRPSPFSIWDWNEYPGFPDLAHVQTALKIALIAGAGVLYFLPRSKGPLQVAALTGALLIGFELVLTHWFYLYIPWFFPFTALALLAPAATRARVEEEARAPGRDEIRELVPAG